MSQSPKKEDNFDRVVREKRSSRIAHEVFKAFERIFRKESKGSPEEFRVSIKVLGKTHTYSGKM